MSYTLFIGDYTYSSWSLRGWLLLRRYGIAAQMQLVDFADPAAWEQVRAHPPARTVPTLLCDDGTVIWDSLAIAEELASRHPDAGIWPADPSLRALARSLAAEMHSGFVALRSTCPMNLRQAFRGLPVTEALRADLDRIETLWTHALERSGGPWLAGEYSAADAFFAPVAARIAGYDLPVGQIAHDYVNRHLEDGAFRRFRALGHACGQELDRYRQPYPQIPWPGPAPIPARPVTSGTPVNERCPYSGEPVTHLMELDGKIWGFCNALCRDKTCADPNAWPDFVALRDRLSG